MIRIVLLFVFLMSGMTSLVVVSADIEVTADERALIHEIVTAQREREKIYGNMHALWNKTEIVNNKTTVTTFEFWSREGVYYRIDRSIVSLPTNINKIRRTIVFPDGHAQTMANSRDELGAVTGFGGKESIAKGMESVRGWEWYCQANKIYYAHIHQELLSWLEGKKKEDRRWESYRVERAADGGALITATTDNIDPADGSKYTWIETFKLSAGDYRFLDGKFNSFRNGEPFFEQVLTKTYAKPQIDVPILWRDVGTPAEGSAEPPKSTNEMSYELKELQLEPASLDVFFLEELNPLVEHQSGFTSSRQLLLLAIGVVCFLVYWRMRKARSLEIENSGGT